MEKAIPTFSIGSQGTLWRTLQTFNVISLMLLAYLSINARKSFWEQEQPFYQEICGIYLVMAALFTLLAFYYKRRFLLQVISQVSADIAVISMLYIAAGGSKSGLAILYLFPLAGGAILAPLLLSLLFSSVVTLVMLSEGSYQLLRDAGDASISQAGLYGAAFFAAVYVINRLAARLIKQETLAAQRGQDLGIQQAINRLVIADMGDGILVLGPDATVFTVNPAAERMLGLLVPAERSRYKLTEIPALIPIADAFFIWAARRTEHTLTPAGSPAYVIVKPADDTNALGVSTVWGGRRELGVHLKLRFARVDTEGLLKDRTVIFLQDVSEIENQAQQLKLASMGRLTASIAHEVRNPLSAISYAAALMGEEAVNSAQSRLVNIVGDNVLRLNQMIEDILKLSRKAQLHGEPILLSSMFAEILAEFQETHGLQAGMIDVGKMGQHRIWFDRLHFREIIVNLLSNAIRYASGRSGSIRLHLVSDLVNRIELHIQDDGPAITPEVRSHLFEPFYTTSSKGTGLGLYVARELCLNNGAMLDYEYRINSSDAGFDEASGRFVITFALPDAS